MKVGIISTFYKNYNYGGKLQAYALTRVLTDMGLEAQQIQYSQRGKVAGSGGKLRKLLISPDYRAAAVQKLAGKLLRREQAAWSLRRKAFDRFDAQIPHTEKIYNDESIPQTNRLFDTFICGSDQVWNPMLLKRSYLLPFVEAGKGKLSYAASIANHLDAHWQDVFRESLADFDAVSVRELQDQSELQALLDKPVERTLDPTLLLRASQWDELAVEPEEQKPYLFCYFLGYSAAMRRCAQAIAKRLGLQLVTMPHMLGASGRFYLSDIGFGDRQIYDATPAEFIGYIRDAAFVATDSFHATVFSLLYQKQFLAFERHAHREMGRRFQALLPLFGCAGRFVSDDCGPDEAIRLCEEPIVYEGETPELERLRQASLDYLRRNIHP